MNVWPFVITAEKWRSCNTWKNVKKWAEPENSKSALQKYWLVWTMSATEPISKNTFGCVSCLLCQFCCWCSELFSLWHPQSDHMIDTRSGPIQISRYRFFIKSSRSKVQKYWIKKINQNRKIEGGINDFYNSIFINIFVASPLFVCDLLLTFVWIVDWIRWNSNEQENQRKMRGFWIYFWMCFFTHFIQILAWVMILNVFLNVFLNVIFECDFE